MKFLWFALLSVLLFSVSSYAEGVKKPLTELLPILEPLKPDAIEIGSGSRDAYVFVDPKCFKSRDFLETITSSATLPKMFHYYIFLYDMPQVDSIKVINAVYDAPVPKEALLRYMLEHQRLSKMNSDTSRQTREQIGRIRHAAEQIGIDRTPYLIVDKKGNEQAH